MVATMNLSSSLGVLLAAVVGLVTSASSNGGTSGGGMIYNVYPWGNQQALSSRQTYLLEVLRENMDLHISQEYLDKYLATVPKNRRYIRQIEGFKYNMVVADNSHVNNTVPSSPVGALVAVDSAVSHTKALPDPYDNDINRNPDALTRYISGTWLTDIQLIIEHDDAINGFDDRALYNAPCTILELRTLSQDRGPPSAL
jgi:hypothetical protein